MTERNNTEAAARQSEGGFRGIFDLVADFYWETDAEHRFTVIEANGATQPEFSAASRLGRTRWEVPHVAPDAEGWGAHRAQLEARQPIRDFETAHIAPDGKVRYYIVAGAPFYDARGVFLGYRGIGREITDRKRVEAELRESQARFRSLIQFSSDFYWETDAEHRFTVLEVGGQSQPQFFSASRLGLTRWEVPSILPDADGWMAHRAVLEARLPFRDFETARAGADGRVRYYAVSGEPEFDAQGRFKGYRGLGTEITERKRAEAALRESEQDLATTLHSIGDAVLTTDIGGRVTRMNPAAERLTGWFFAQARGRLVDEVYRTIDERTRASAVVPVATVLATGEVQSNAGVAALIARDGTERPVAETAAPIRDAANRVRGVVLVFRDVTAERRAERTIREQNDLLEQRVRERTAELEAANRKLHGEIAGRGQAERRIRTQLEHLGLLDEITRSTGERLDLKSIFQIVLGRLEESLPVDFGCVCLHDAVAGALQVSCVGTKSGTLAHELMLVEHATIGIDANGLARCVQGQLVYEPELSQVRFPFPERLARGGLGSAVLAPLRSESRVFGVLVVARRAANAFSSAECEFLRQLSEHVALAAHQAQLYGSLQQAYDDLRQTQAAAMQEERLRALGQMASGIAHDINNALSPVSLYVESLLETERALSGRARGYLQTIQRAVQDVAQTVARLREFYRQREQQIELAPVQLNTMVQQVLDLTRARWRDQPMQSGIVIRVQTELAPGLPQVMGVESEIREALTNLVFNAVDAMPEGGTLTLRTRVAESNPHPALAVEVADTGSGMDEDTRRRCLEPFFTTKGERGTGLGLAMVFGMVQRHSAGIEIDSAPGAGTTVRLVFAVPAVVQADAGAPVRPLEVPAGLRLLLVDDDPILLKSLRDTLESDGHMIVTANGGEAGIAEFRAAQGRGAPFAAVITDLGMPYVDGRQVAAAVKEASPATPVILLTGWGQRLVAQGEIPAHVDRVLAKPPKLREVRETLAQLCRPATTEPSA